MKHSITLLYVIISLSVFAKTGREASFLQQKADSTQVQISLAYLLKIENENSSLKKQLEEKIKHNDGLRKDSADCADKLSKLEKDVERLKLDTINLYRKQRETDEKLLKADEKLLNADKKLVNIASNFLYIPYEAYSIERIAIPAFEAVTNETLKQEHQVKYNLLRSYKTDLENVLSFIDDAEKRLKATFVTSEDAKDVISKLRGAPFYQSYRNYSDRDNTFLGGKLSFLEKQLNKFDGRSHRIDFDTIKEELKRCLKTVEEL